MHLAVMCALCANRSRRFVHGGLAQVPSETIPLEIRVSAKGVSNYVCGSGSAGACCDHTPQQATDQGEGAKFQEPPMNC